MLTMSRKDIEEAISAFIWSYKIEGNVRYNLDIVFALYEASERVPSQRATAFYKPLIVFIVSIIEALLFDLVVRLDEATRQFPESLLSRMSDIKHRTQRMRKPTRRGTTQISDKLESLIDFYKRAELFGRQDAGLYKNLEKAAAIRNRLHIQNVFNKLERDEDWVFSRGRLEGIEKMFEMILQKMSTDYVRPDRKNLGA